MSLLDDIAALDEDALVLWDKVGVELGESDKYELLIDRFCMTIDREPHWRYKMLPVIVCGGWFLAVYVKGHGWVERFNWPALLRDKATGWEDLQAFEHRVFQAWRSISQPS